MKIALGLCLLLLLGAQDLEAQELFLGGRPAEGKQSLKAERSASERREKIRTEIKTLSGHPWAGEYYAGDGLGANTTLAVAPDAGYVFEWYGCMGLYDRNYGAVKEKNDRLRLVFTFKNKEKGAFIGVAPELIPVAWGPRHYLVPADDVLGFCNKINEGAEPRTAMHGRYFLREGDNARKAVGAPTLPEKFRACLLPEPVRANLVAIAAHPARARGANAESKPKLATIDAGANQGLRVGMKLFATNREAFLETVELTRVEADRSEGKLELVDENSPGPQVGWTFSTRAP